MLIARPGVAKAAIFVPKRVDPRPSSRFWSGRECHIARVQACKFAIFGRGQFRTRPTLAPQTFKPLAVVGRGLVIISRRARALQRRYHQVGFLVVPLYGFLIPRMWAPSPVELCEPRYFVAQLLRQSRVHFKAVAIGDNGGLWWSARLLRMDVGQRCKRHFDLGRVKVVARQNEPNRWDRLKLQFVGSGDIHSIG